MPHFWLSKEELATFSDWKLAKYMSLCSREELLWRASFPLELDEYDYAIAMEERDDRLRGKPISAQRFDPTDYDAPLGASFHEARLASSAATVAASSFTASSSATVTAAEAFTASSGATVAASSSLTVATSSVTASSGATVTYSSYDLFGRPIFTEKDLEDMIE